MLDDDVVGQYLQSALEDMATHGRHWLKAMSRSEARRVCELISQAGYAVQLHELPPEWEHVVAAPAISHCELFVLAEMRAKLRSFGTPDSGLPR